MRKFSLAVPSLGYVFEVVDIQGYTATADFTQCEMMSLPSLEESKQKVDV